MIRSLGFTDPTRLIVWASQQRDLLKRGDQGLRSLLLIDGRRRHRGLDKWSPLKSAINRGQALADALTENSAVKLLIIRAEIETLDPGHTVDWNEIKEEIQVHVGINCSPMDILYYPPGQMMMAAGQIVFVPPGWRSAVNLGETMRTHLVLTLRANKAIEDASP